MDDIAYVLWFCAYSSRTQPSPWRRLSYRNATRYDVHAFKQPGRIDVSSAFQSSFGLVSNFARAFLVVTGGGIACWFYHYKAATTLSAIFSSPWFLLQAGCWFLQRFFQCYRHGWWMFGHSGVVQRVDNMRSETWRGNAA
jgi:hypothetical protein